MKPKQPVSVAGIEFDALIDSSEKWEASVPSYPVDEGYSVSDNMALQPLTLDMTLYVTNTPVTWLSRHGSGADRVNRIVRQLQQLYFNKDIFEVTTQDGSYANMVIEAITVKKDADFGYAKEIPVTLRQVTYTSSSSQTVPDSYARSGATGTKSGTAATNTIDGSSSTKAIENAVKNSGSGSSSKSSEEDNRSMAAKFADTAKSGTNATVEMTKTIPVIGNVVESFGNTYGR